MKSTFIKVSTVVLVLGMLLAACVTTSYTPTVTEQPITQDEPTKIIGNFAYTNEFAVETYYVEQAVGLLDMHGFVKRDKEWKLPIEGQVLGYMNVDYPNNTGTYFLYLPAKPEGTFDDVDNNATADTGVQIYSVAYNPNLAGGPFSEGDDPSYGWPGYLASVKTDSENQDEVIGGKLVVWAPDDQQQFPTGFGADGRLFTKDDPVGAISAGWTVIDLDTTPFALMREADPSLTLFEPKDIAMKDYSADSYTGAFQKMFDFLKVEYAFNGIEGKQPDWDTIYNTVYPKIQAAETAGDATAYYLALREFSWAFTDGHVGINGGNAESQVFSEATAAGYGFAIRETDDGKVIVTYVLTGGPAQKAGILLGAEVTEWNGQPILDALRLVEPLAAPFSTEFAKEYQQDRYLLRAKAGTEAQVKYINSGGQPVEATLKAVAERDSFNATSIYKGFDSNALPVEFKIITDLNGSVGYIKINSNYDDLNLIIRLFDRALKTFSANEVLGIIIDMRQNSGGANLGLAGFLYDKEILMGQLEYYSTTTGKFEPEGLREKVLPNVEQYTFDKMVLMVGQACASACELEAYGFSQVPGMQVLGYYPSGGIEAEVARGQFLLPEGFSAQFPTGRFTLPDGSILLEGKGVQPTLPVARTAENLLSMDDVELDTAVKYVVFPVGAGVTPSGAPELLAATDAEAKLLDGNVDQLESFAPQSYEGSNPAPGEHWAYTIPFKKTKDVAWLYGWCADKQATLDENFGHIKLKFILDGNQVSMEQLGTFTYPAQGIMCKIVYAVLTKWPAGEHHLSIETTFDASINDGSADYPAGTFYYDYTVYIAE
jgi:C-terminal processing protease CtpA/Prc